LPCTQVVALGGHGVFALVYGVCWHSKAGNMTKTSLAVEVWSLTRYAAELLIWALEDVRYGLGLGGVSACWSGAGCAITYFGDRIDQEETKVQAQASLFDFTGDGPVGGPPIPQGALNAYCRAVPINLRWALRVDQREGCGYVQLLEAVERVVPAAGGAAGQGPVYGRYVHGLALREGGPEEEITITVPKTATDD